MKKWTFKVFGWALKPTPSLLGAKLVLVLVLVPITYLAYLCPCVPMCGYLAPHSTVDLPHGTTHQAGITANTSGRCVNFTKGKVKKKFS